MMAMTMPYKVRNAKEFESLKPGDLITSRLIIESNDAYLTDVKKVGEAPLETPPPGCGRRIVRVRAAQGGPACSDREVRRTRMGSPWTWPRSRARCWRSRSSTHGVRCLRSARSWIGTSSTVQAALKKNPALSSVRLLSVSFDPAHRHAARAEEARRSAEGRPEGVVVSDRRPRRGGPVRGHASASRITREMNDQRDITHNLRTAIVDASGNFVKAFTGNEWSPDELIADLERVAGAK